MKKSNFLSWNLKDWQRALIMTIIGSIVGGLIDALQSGGVTWETLKAIGWGALIAGLAYIKLTFFTNSKNEFLKSDPKE